MGSAINFNPRKLKLIKASSIVVPFIYVILTGIYWFRIERTSTHFAFTKKIFLYSILSTALLILFSSFYKIIAADLGIPLAYGTFRTVWILFWIYFTVYSIWVNRIVDRNYSS